MFDLLFFEKKKEKNHEISFVQYRVGVNEIEIHVCSRFFIRWLKIDRQKRCTGIFFPHASKLKWKSDIEMKVNIFSGRVFVLMIVRWHEEIISIEWNEWSFPTIFHRDTMLKTQLVLIAFNYIIYFRLFDIRIHAFNSNGSSSD